MTADCDGRNAEESAGEKHKENNDLIDIQTKI
jgi:hypothetical protein